MIKWLRKRLASDRGDAVLVTGIVSIPLFFICMGMAIDVTSNVVQKQAYASMATSSAESAIRNIKADGGLDQTAIDAFVVEYKIQRDSKADLRSDPGAGSSETSGRRGTCTTAEINGVERTLPYMEVRLDTQRNQGTSGLATSPYIMEGNEEIAKPSIPSNRTYRVIEATVYEANNNMIMGMFGGNVCQVHENKVSAVAFGNQRDLNDVVTGPEFSSGKTP